MPKFGECRKVLYCTCRCLPPKRTCWPEIKRVVYGVSNSRYRMVMARQFWSKDQKCSGLAVVLLADRPEVHRRMVCPLVEPSSVRLPMFSNEASCPPPSQLTLNSYV